MFASNPQIGLHIPSDCQVLCPTALTIRNFASNITSCEYADLELHDDEALDSSAGTSRAGQLHMDTPASPRAGQLHVENPASPRAGQVQMEAPMSPRSPSHPGDEIEEPPLEAASSPVLRAIPFMAPSHSPTHPHEISLDAWGAGRGEAFEGWDNDEDDWMNQ